MSPQPYREDPALARYPLHTSWRTVIVLAGREVVIAIAISGGVLRATEMLRGITPVWLVVLAVLFPFAAFLLWLKQLPRLVVRDGTAIELRRDRLDIVAPGRPARSIALSALEVTVSGTQFEQVRVVEGRRVRTTVQRPTDVLIVGPDVQLDVSASTFDSVADAARLASDVERVRAGKEPLARGAFDLAAIASVVEQAMAMVAPAKTTEAAARDELDDRIDRELAALDGHTDDRCE